MKYYAAASFLAVILVPIAVAEEDEGHVGWIGEGAISAGMTRGNTDTSDVGIKLDMERLANAWTFGFDSEVDYGQEDGVESRNRAFIAADIDHKTTDNLFTFGRVSYEVDQFTGFDSRGFAGGGVGYRTAGDGPLSWVVKGGPGVKVDEVKRVVTVDDANQPLIIPASRETSVGGVGTSEFGWQINDKVKLTNDTSVVYADESTQFSNGIALTAALNGSLSARVSFDTRFDTNPPLGYESTDAASKISLVYKLGH